MEEEEKREGNEERREGKYNVSKLKMSEGEKDKMKKRKNKRGRKERRREGRREEEMKRPMD